MAACQNCERLNPHFRYISVSDDLLMAADAIIDACNIVMKARQRSTPNG